MASTSTSSAKYGSIDTQHGEKEPVQLVVMFPKVAQLPLSAMERALQYARDPTSYLKEVLGDQVFEERKSKLCIPETIDRDFYGTGTHKQNFETHIASLLGKKHGLFFITGIGAQLAALNAYCNRNPNYRVAWHISSHLESAEEEAYSKLYKLKRILLGSDPEALPTMDEIKEVLARPESARPAAIVIEIPNRTLGCKTYTFEELEEISAECRKANVRLHCDGARLWEIEPYYEAVGGKSFADISALFDSLYVSFYKGVGGAAGAMVVSDDEEMIREAKVWQRRQGGNVISSYFQIIDCERGYNENIGCFAERRKKMMEIVDGIKEATKGFKTKDGVPYVSFVPEEATCCQIHTVFQGFKEEDVLAARDRVAEKKGIRVFEKLRPKKTVDEKMKEDREVKETNGEAGTNGVVDQDDPRHYTEWRIMEANEHIETRIFIEGYIALCEELAGSVSRS